MSSIAATALLIVVAGNGASANLSRILGSYVGQAAPDDSPEPFAPGVVTTELHDDGPPAITPDGDEMFFRVVVRGPQGIRASILHAKRVEGLWSEPELASFSNEFGEIEGRVALRPDGRRLFIYVSFPDGRGGWRAPVNLGPEVNSPSSDKFAGFSPEGRHLFFVSRRKFTGGSKSRHWIAKLPPAETQPNDVDVYWVSATVLHRARGVDAQTPGADP